MTCEIPLTYDPEEIEVVGTIVRLIPPTLESTVIVDIEFRMESLTSISEVVTKSGSDDIKYFFFVDEDRKYWNGAAWAQSDGTFLESNTVAEINANVATFPVNDGSRVMIAAVLKGTATTTPELEEINVNFDYHPGLPDSSSECTVYVRLQDILGDDLCETAHEPKLVAVNDRSFTVNNAVIAKFYKEVDFTDQGGLYASVSIIKTYAVDYGIRFIITYRPNGESSEVRSIFMKPAVIPNATIVDLTTISAVDQQQLI